MPDTNRSFILTTLLALLLFSGCISDIRTYVAEPDRDWKEKTVPSDVREVFRVYLIGDTGAPDLGGDSFDQTFRLLKQHLAEAGDSSALVFLGDNIYCCGMPPLASSSREKAESVIEAHTQLFDGYRGNVYFVPGNHDWNDSRPGGLTAIRRQETYLESIANRGNIFIPDDGYPGPVEVELTDDITLVAIDTEWWLYRYYKPRGDTGEYDIRDDEDFFIELEDLIVNDLEDDDVLVVAHHPVVTNGTHGGQINPRAHLFPLTLDYRKAYVPLPVIGTIAVLYYRYFGGGRQDIQHPRYRMLRQSLQGIFAEHERLIFASGHEHSLQYFRVGTDDLHQDYVVSGSGSKPTHIARGRGATFVSNPEGYATLHYYDDRSVWLQFWDTLTEPDSSKLIFRKQLKESRIILEEDEPIVEEHVDIPDYADSVAVVAINPDYQAGDLKEFFLGAHHRDLWAARVTAPYLDMERDAGGLRPVKKGGGMQTVSLRLHGEDGREYVLRSLDKDPSGTVPVFLQGTVATDIVQDQIASINPYAAFILPSLARAAGIYHTNPRLVYVPDDPRLGPFRETFANRLMMFEDRPSDDESDQPSYGFTEDVESAATMYRHISDDNDYRVDQEAFARARLFDMWLSDWDRHRDQWRWSSFEDPDGKGDIYLPIPRDRDWALNKMNGIFPTLASQFDAKFQDFSSSYGNLKGLTINGHEQDRRLLNKLTRTQWAEIASELEESLTDSVIEAAVRQWPDAIFELVGEETINLLKTRREKLSEVADEYYELLAGVADFVGSHKHELVEVDISSEGTVDLHVIKTSSEGEERRTVYRRTFSEDETKEIRIFGLDGNDQFQFTGGRTSINLIVVGGPGNDSIINGSDSDIDYFDTELETSTDPANLDLRIEDSPLVNEYNPLDFKHNARLPQIFFGHNSDDGVFVGGGLLFVRHGFRKDPFKRSHRIVGNIAGRTGAFNIDYKTVFTDISGIWDAEIHTFLSSPATIRNFYGFGNDTERGVDNRAFYESRLTQFGVEPSLVANIATGLSATVGSSFLVTSVRDDENRFIGQTDQVSEGIFDTQYLAGINGAVRVDNVDIRTTPSSGFRWDNSVGAHAGINTTQDLFVTLSTDFRVYATPLSNRFTIALRTGADHIVGDFPYYMSSTLGGSTNLRGYFKDRFAGRTTFYQNAEARIRLFDFSTYLAIGRLGVLGFLDNGRVWYEDLESGKWHQGYGGGVWTNLLQVITLSSWVATSEDATTVSFRFGFQY